MADEASLERTINLMITECEDGIRCFPFRIFRLPSDVPLLKQGIIEKEKIKQIADYLVTTRSGDPSIFRQMLDYAPAVRDINAGHDPLRVLEKYTSRGLADEW